MDEGTSTSYTLQLSSFPSSDVTINLSTESSYIIINPTQVVLSNQSTVKMITITHNSPSSYLNDVIYDAIIKHEVTSSDPSYGSNTKFSIGESLKVTIMNPCVPG